MWKYNNIENLYSPELYHSADELYHHGVLGMRWRHRKAQIKADKQLRNYRRRDNSERFKKEVDENIRTYGTKKMRRASNFARGFGLVETGIGAHYLKKAIKGNYVDKGQRIVDGIFGGLALTGGVINIKRGNVANRYVKDYELKQYKAKYNKKKK